MLLPNFFILCSICFALPQSTSGSLSVGQLLEDVRAQLPRESLVISGDLIVRKRKGIVTRTLTFDMSLNLGSQPETLRCVIRDAFGKELEQLTVTHRAGQEPCFEYAAGSSLSPSDLPSLFDCVQGTDISWTDLTLSFLWWRGGTTVGIETIRGRSCLVVEVPTPAGLRHAVPGSAGGFAEARTATAALAGESTPEAGTQAGRQYERVLLWIDEKLRVVLQAEGYDSGGKLVRRFWINSFKKIDDKWMLKDMEVESFPSTHRTRLRVREVCPPVAR